MLGITGCQLARSLSFPIKESDGYVPVVIKWVYAVGVFCTFYSEKDVGGFPHAVRQMLPEQFL